MKVQEVDIVRELVGACDCYKEVLVHLVEILSGQEPPLEPGWEGIEVIAACTIADEVIARAKSLLEKGQEESGTT